MRTQKQNLNSFPANISLIYRFGNLYISQMPLCDAENCTLECNVLDNAANYSNCCQQTKHISTTLFVFRPTALFFNIRRILSAPHFL